MPATPDIFALSLELLLESPHGVVLCGLSRPELNGKRGRCVGQVEGDIRLHVSVEGSEDLVQIRPSCLKIAPDPEQAEYEREYDQATKQQYAMHVARGQHAFTDGHLREAAEALVRAKQLCPKHPRACGLLGTTYQRMATEPNCTDICSNLVPRQYYFKKELYLQAFPFWKLRVGGPVFT